MKAYISSIKVKSVTEDDVQICYSFDHLQRYNDAILYGAKRQKVTLSDSFKAQINNYTDSLKKENQKANKNGQCKE